jgi:hypothetical protein
MCEPWCPPTKAEIEAEKRWAAAHPEEWKKMWEKPWWGPWTIGAIAYTPILVIIVVLIFIGTAHGKQSKTSTQHGSESTIRTLVP